MTTTKEGSTRGRVRVSNPPSFHIPKTQDFFALHLPEAFVQIDRHTDMIGDDPDHVSEAGPP